MRFEVSASPSSPPISGVLGERNDLLQRRGERRGERGVTANGARAVQFEPGIKTTLVEEMAALRHHPQHLRILVLAQTNGARGVIAPRALPVTELEPRVRVYDALLQPHGAALLLLLLRHEDHAREDDPAVGRPGSGGGLGGGARAVAAGAAAEVGGEEEGGEEEEEGEGYGDGVAEAEVGEVGVRVRVRVRVRRGHGSGGGIE